MTFGSEISFDASSMKVILASHVFAPSVGGIETMSMALAGEFVRQGHEVKVVTQTPGSNSDDLPYDVVRQPKAIQLLRLTRWSDVFFQNNVSLQTIWAAFVARRPLVIAHHTWLTRPYGTLGRQEKLKRFACRFARCISISQAVADHAPSPSVVIGNCYRDELFRVLPGVAREKDIVFVGRLVSDKGADVLLDAVQKLAALGRTVGVTIVGDGPEYAKLKQQAEDLGIAEQVAFVGSQQGEELVRMLNRHKIMAVPSRWREPFGIVALEGIACGCLVVASADGGLTDAVGSCGVTFPNGDAHALAAALDALLADEDKKKCLLKNAPEHLARHTTQAVADAYLQVLTEAAR